MKKATVPRETTEQKQMKELGTALKNIRLTQSKLIQDIEKESEISVVTISNLEKGKLNNLSLKTLNRIAEALNCTIHIQIKYK